MAKVFFSCEACCFCIVDGPYGGGRCFNSKSPYYGQWPGMFGSCAQGKPIRHLVKLQKA